jgi:hypothetical protein
MQVMRLITCIALLATCHASTLRTSAKTKAKSKSKSLRFQAPPVEPNVVLPLSFEQQLLVCNAYPGGSPLTVKQNGQEAPAGNRDIQFQECRQISSKAHSKDKLDFILAGSGVQGTFEIGELPNTDAMLLLVVQKRDTKSALMSFQSFAFPTRSDGKNAQLAVIDSYKGSSNSPHLRMEDHVDSKEKKTISKRVEQLSFNRIYAIEEGTYEASISDHAPDKEDQGAESEKKTFRLEKKHNYVILRTGDDKIHQSLVVYPEIPRNQTGAAQSSILTARIGIPASIGGIALVIIAGAWML